MNRDSKWFDYNLPRRPETRVLGEYLYKMFKKWSGTSHIVYWTQRETDTLEVVYMSGDTGSGLRAAKQGFCAYIHYDTQFLWLWYGGGRVFKCTNVNEFVIALQSIRMYYSSNGGLAD